MWLNQAFALGREVLEETEENHIRPQSPRLLIPLQLLYSFLSTDFWTISSHSRLSSLNKPPFRCFDISYLLEKQISLVNKHTDSRWISKFLVFIRYLLWSLIVISLDWFCIVLDAPRPLPAHIIVPEKKERKHSNVFLRSSTMQLYN